MDGGAMIEEIVIYVDYIGASKYGVFVDDPVKEKPDAVHKTVDASLSYIADKFGIDTHVEISHCAEIIFKLERNLDMDENLS
jgi:hypothetical protein